MARLFLSRMQVKGKHYYYGLSLSTGQIITSTEPVLWHYFSIAVIELLWFMITWICLSFFSLMMTAGAIKINFPLTFAHDTRDFFIGVFLYHEQLKEGIKVFGDGIVFLESSIHEIFRTHTTHRDSQCVQPQIKEGHNFFFFFFFRLFLGRGRHGESFFSNISGSTHLSLVLPSYLTLFRPKKALPKSKGHKVCMGEIEEMITICHLSIFFLIKDLC